eukprot:TRINITY_DN1526_c0_g1_i2.p1 TRINITY_DN1526_c0_g1~~TRINITY_DN1526_c0_g1_i2.p1  ORF type:complete len:125 (+),score=17.72 TRINITY_DN1526_c0_g1_i2:701-1075(+)
MFCLSNQSECNSKENEFSRCRTDDNIENRPPFSSNSQMVIEGSVETFDKKTLKKIDSIKDVDKMTTAELFSLAPTFGLKANTPPDILRRTLKDVISYVIHNNLNESYTQGYKESIRSLFAFKDK